MLSRPRSRREYVVANIGAEADPLRTAATTQKRDIRGAQSNAGDLIFIGGNS